MPAGRPTKLTPELILQVCEIVAKGNYRGVAAKACGVPQRTFSHWLKQGKEFPNGLYGDLLLMLETAEGAAEMSALAKVIDSRDPKCAQWYLARKFPNRWGAERLDIVDVSNRLAAIEERLGDDVGDDSPPADKDD